MVQDKTCPAGTNTLQFMKYFVDSMSKAMFTSQT